MHARSIILLVATAIPFAALAGALNPSGSRFPYVARQSSYTVQDWYSGNDFFTQWDFYTGADPTNGNVNYLSLEDAQNDGLAYLNDNNAVVLAVDSTSSVSPGGNRNSVRISSQKTYNSGLFIFDVAAMPVGCGTWPSIWTCGPNWPTAGEIDIVEGINNQANNQMTLHSGTSVACTIDKSVTGTFTGQILGAGNCYSTPTADSGCSIKDVDTSSFGYGFNDVGGGVFAFLWDVSAGMSMWYFHRSNIPSDITNTSPTPSNWGEPAGFWSSATCDISANFYEHSIIIDTTICGSWAGNAYGNSQCPGTCEEMVANATNFLDAQWVINYIAVYS